MADKKQIINAIIDEIFNLSEPKIDPSRKLLITDFINSAINGDDPNSYLVINANLGENNQGAIIYILTNSRIIKIDIDAKEVKSTSFYLETIAGVERQLLDNDTSRFLIRFQNGLSMGLKYDSTNHRISEFFQKLDQPKLQQPRT